MRGTAQKCLSWLRGDRIGQSKNRKKKRCVWSGVANVTFSIYTFSSFSLLTNAPASLTQKISRHRCIEVGRGLNRERKARI